MWFAIALSQTHFCMQVIGLGCKFSSTVHLEIRELCHQKTCLMPYANNKDADQPAHPRSLVSAFIIHSIDSIITIDAIPKFSRH